MERKMSGRVYITGAGPGDPGLLTRRAAELLRTADVVLYDRLVGDGVLALVGDGVRREYVGRAVGDDASHQDATNELMASYAEQGLGVVRLKGGDPVIFGRGGEEAEFLRARGIKYEIVPGISSAIAAPAYAGVPLTHRGRSSSVVIVTGHEDPSKESEQVRWRRLARAAGTIVVLMGAARIAEICAHLADGGLEPDTPAAVIQDGTTDRQRVVRGTLVTIADAAAESGIRPPAVIVIGSVAELAGTLAWR